MAAVTYRFGPFLADRTGYRVVRAGEAVELTPKLLDLLFHLLDHAGSLVTKEELLDTLWPGANVTENALSQAVSDLRHALADEAGSPKFIKTVARRGYRFIAPVEPVETHPIRPEPSRPTHVQAERTIAVMDFVNMTGDPDSAWLSAGIAETVTGDLRALAHFRVVDRWRVMEATRRAAGSLPEISADLGARLAVVGSYQRSSDRIRITARVVDVISGEAVADAKVDGPFDDIFTLQDQVVTQLATDLGLSMAPARAFTHRDTASLEAYRAFSEGWVRLESLDIREMPQAIADFEHAAAADPRYALAHTGLANAAIVLYEATRSDNEPRTDLLDRAVRHAHHAAELDGSLAEAHASLAHALVGLWRMREAIVAARRAVALEPSNWRHLFRLGHASWGDERLRAANSTLALYPDFAFAHFQIAMVYVARGQLHQAETVLRQGAAVQDRQIGRRSRYPALGLHWLLGLVRLAEDDVDEAIEQFERERSLAEPHRLYGREFAMYALHGLGAALLRGRRTDDAVDHFRCALELYPGHVPSLLGLARGQRAGGSVGAAENAIDRAERTLVTLARTRPIEAALVRGQWLAARGDVAGSAAGLARLLVDAPPGFAGWTLPVEPFLRELHGTQAFTEVLDRLAARAR
jgi:DNA-binding winged helix-turn-helix (wHTH) protein/Tfp pilus assembly protein PilF